MSNPAIRIKTKAEQMLRLAVVRANTFVMQYLNQKRDFLQIRNKANMSFSDVANFLNVSSSELELLESGDRAPSAQQIAALGLMASLSQSKAGFLVHPKEPELSRPKPRSRKVELAQFFTSQPVAKFMVEMFDPTTAPVNLLDAGAGEGALSIAFLNQYSALSFVSGEAHEIDSFTFDGLKSALSATSLGSHKIDAFRTDFIEWATAELKLGQGKRFTHSVLNPPYKKIASTSKYRSLLRSVGLETVNLYSGFVAMAVAMTKQNGEVVAIIPRSFCNGPYYVGFRKFILEHCAIEAIHLFERRDSVFSKDSVLQENVIIKLRVGTEAGLVKISESRDESFVDLRERFVAFSEIVRPEDPDLFIHIPLGNRIHSATAKKFNTSLPELGVECSTGPVVDFRAQRYLSKEYKPSFAPLLYPLHFIENKLEWPAQSPKKANAIEVCAATAKQLLPKGYYVVVRRFSSKEEEWRINPGIVDPLKLLGDFIGIENHLNYFHKGKKPLNKLLCWGLSAFLSSTVVDTEFRNFSGHTQVNSTDLRKLRYPSLAVLMDMGQKFMEIGYLDRQLVDAHLEAEA